MQNRMTFQQAVTEYAVQLPLPLPEIPGVRANRTDVCRHCRQVHSGAYDDIACKWEYHHLHPD